MAAGRGATPPACRYDSAIAFQLSRWARGTRSIHANVAAFRRGYRFARNLGQPTPDDGQSSPCELESYFDALVEGPGLWKWRHYCPIYERHLGKFVDNRPRMMEIGIFSGGSLGMWRSYFGDGTHLYGLDIEPDCMAYADESTEVFIGDQSDRQFLRTVVQQAQPLDIVLDDGGHLAHQQIASFEEIFPYVKPGGVYIFEDVQTPQQAFHSYIAGLTRPMHDMHHWQAFSTNRCRR